MDAAVAREGAEALEARSGLTLAGAFAFGDSPELADELLAFVHRGTKRATAGSVADLEEADEPFPEPGLCWGLLDGRGEPCYVMETTQVRVGRLDSVDPAFAWDEGEDDRTYESWLNGHRRFFRRQGVPDPDALEVVFERFRIVWPTPDRARWLADGVRETDLDDRRWAAQVLAARRGTAAVATPRGQVDPGELPALVAERAGEQIGLLTFRPWPGGVTDVATIDVPSDDATVARALRAGLRALAEQEGWTDVHWPDERR